MHDINKKCACNIEKKNVSKMEKVLKFSLAHYSTHPFISAPGYFDDFYLDGMIHQDGGILANNPTQIAIHEAQKIWPGHKLQWWDKNTQSEDRLGQSLINCNSFFSVMSLGLGRPAFSFQPSTVGEKKRALSITEKFSRIVDSATDTVANFYMKNSGFLK